MFLRNMCSGVTLENSSDGRNDCYFKIVYFSNIHVQTFKCSLANLKFKNPLIYWLFLKGTEVTGFFGAQYNIFWLMKKITNNLNETRPYLTKQTDRPQVLKTHMIDKIQRKIFWNSHFLIFRDLKKNNLIWLVYHKMKKAKEIST